MLIFDLETNGLYATVSTIHTLCIFDIDKHYFKRYDKQMVREGLERLSQADCICGHNIINYDIPVIKKLVPSWTHNDVIDTLVWARLVRGNVKETDYHLFDTGSLPGKLLGSQSLEAWGYRLGVLKGDYCKREDAWSHWTPEMSAYCEQDVRVTVKLYSYLESLPLSQEAFELEHEIAWILARQERRGFAFDYDKAQKLYEHLLLEQIKLKNQLQELVTPFYMPRSPYKPFIPKQDNKRQGYFKNAPVSKIELVEFNPNSRHHIALVLKRLHKWNPEEWNEKDKSALLRLLCNWQSSPKVDDDILKSLPYPEAKIIGDYMTVVKRIGQISDGDQAWLKFYNKDTKAIHGAVNSNGAVTGRMTHFAPNLAQVPASYSLYGKECRELFHARPRYVLVGCDASGLEARILAHFLARYDGGEYVKAVTEGRKEDKTDVHNLTLKALGNVCKDRDVAKHFLYSYLYGAGPEKIAKILSCTPKEAKKAMEVFLKAIPALKMLKEDLEKAVKEKKGYLRGIDGRLLYVRSAHSALNLICQSAGAIVMKKALVLLDQRCPELGWIPGKDYEFVGNVHDEFQSEISNLSDQPDTFGKMAVQAIIDAGIHFNLRCPLDGEYKIGRTWRDTH